MPEPIFVFGSNLAGRHGKGAAKWARENRGAIYGKGYGLQGDSFAIPTKSAKLATLPLKVIKFYVDCFKQFAEDNPHLQFQLTPIGCGLAGYSREHIEPMFANASANVLWPPEWEK